MSIGALSVATAFQVEDVHAPPPNLGQPVATQVLVDHVFANSWGAPSVSQYSPPSQKFTHVYLKLDWEVSGIQYDRLGHLYMNDVEIWRPSTLEPRGDTSYATYTKDVTEFLAAFKAPGTVTFDLGNTVQGGLTGAFNTHVTAYFYDADSAANTEASWYHNNNEACDVVFPLIRQQQGANNAIDNIEIPTIPRNTTRAVLHIGASGNNMEEFYYMNPLSQSNGPTRLLEIYINGQIAGLINPYQPIYSGGINPLFWMPYVGLRVFDVPMYKIDISAFLPALWESSGTLSIKIRNGYNDEGVSQDWIISSALQLWQTNGAFGFGFQRPTSYSNDSFDRSLGGLPSADGVQVTRNLKTSASLTFLNGHDFGQFLTSFDVSLEQQLSILSVQTSNRDATNYAISTSYGSDKITRNDDTFSRDYSYPLGIAYGVNDQIYISRAYNLKTSNPSGSQDLSSRQRVLKRSDVVNQVTIDSRPSSGPAFFRQTKETNMNVVLDVTDQQSSSSDLFMCEDAGATQRALERAISAVRSGSAVDAYSSLDSLIDGGRLFATAMRSNNATILSLGLPSLPRRVPNIKAFYV